VRVRGLRSRSRLHSERSGSLRPAVAGDCEGEKQEWVLRGSHLVAIISGTRNRSTKRSTAVAARVLMRLTAVAARVLTSSGSVLSVLSVLSTLVFIYYILVVDTAAPTATLQASSSFSSWLAALCTSHWGWPRTLHFASRGRAESRTQTGIEMGVTNGDHRSRQAYSTVLVLSPSPSPKHAKTAGPGA